MTQHTPWINNGGRIDRLTEDGIPEVLCTVGEVNNQRPEDTRKAQRIVACVNFCGNVLTDALEESNLEGMYTRGACDDLKAMAVKFRDQIAQLRQDKAELVETLEEIRQKRAKSMLEDCAYQGPPPKTWVKETAPHYEGYNQALKECQVIAEAAIAKHGKES